MNYTRRRALTLTASAAGALALNACMGPHQAPKPTAAVNAPSMMDKPGTRKMRADRVGRFDLSAIPVPKESVGLPVGVNDVAYMTADPDKLVDITLKFPRDTLVVRTAEFGMATDSENSYIGSVRWSVVVEGMEAADEAVAQAHERFGFTARNIAAWDSKEFLTGVADIYAKVPTEGVQSLGMGVKNGTATYLGISWQNDSPTQVLRFSAWISPGYYLPEVQAEMVRYGRAPIGFNPDQAEDSPDQAPDLARRDLSG